MNLRVCLQLRTLLALTALLSFLFAFGCSATPSPEEAPPAPPPPSFTKPVFSFETLDGGELSTSSLVGRISVIGLIATYDLASQAQARFLTGLLRHHTPRLNVAVLVLESPENRPLVEGFVAALKLPYPVAIADAATIAGEGPFPGLHHVPSIVILDRQGFEVSRQLGLQTEDMLEETLRTIEQKKVVPPSRSSTP